MARPYSNDLRQRVVAAVRSGMTCRQVAEIYGIAVSSVVKWSQRERATGSVAAKPMGGHRPVILTGERNWLLGRINAPDSDVTLRGLQAELSQRGVVVSYGTLWNFMHREGLSHKKNRIRERARSPGHHAQAGTMEKASSQD